MHSSSVAAGMLPTDIAPLDLLGLGLVALLVILGVWRGLWWQVIRLAGVVAAVAVARALGPDFAEWIRANWPGLPPRLAGGAAWFGIFLGVLLVATLLGLLGQRLIEAMQLGLANRIGGGAVGAVTGVLVHVAVLIAICQLAPEPFVGRVVAGTYSEKLVETVGQRWEVVIDGESADRIERLLRAPANGDETRPRGPQDEPGEDSGR